MNPRATAQGLAAFGRGPDTTLVHMTPGEVAGLQTLAMKHGGSLSINPHTGLPEAGILSSLLPTLAGAGLAAAGVPNPWMAGLLVGGLGALSTGSLKKGLMAGLGAYGGAGLGSSLIGMGDAAAAEAAKQMAGAEALGTTPAAISTPQGLGAALQQTVPVDMYEYGAMPGMDSDKLRAYSEAFQSAQAPKAEGFAGQMGRMGEGVTRAMAYPGEVMTKDNMKYAGAAAAPLLQAGLGALQPKAGMAPGSAGSAPATYYSTGFRPGEVNPRFGQPGEPYFLDRNFGAGASTNVFPYADGGVVPAPNEFYPQANINRAYYNTPTQDPLHAEVMHGYDAGVDPFTGAERMAAGGVTGEYAAGGRLLRGPGDGVSDSIPAVIKGNTPQRAALADGEFVLPARIVSEIGNGSTEAGARKLYAMMDRIQNQRKRTLRDVAADTKAEKMLPA